MEPFTGQIIMFAGNFAPENWAFCDGQLLPISQNAALFSLLGTTYGGDGRSTFGLPDLRGRVPLHAGKGPLLSRDYQLGKKGGDEFVKLDETQIPYHKHAIDTSGGSNATSTADLKVSDSVADTSDPLLANSLAGKMNPVTKLLSTKDAKTVLKDCVTGIQSGASIPSVTEVTGGSQTHPNMQPYLALNYIICFDGLYPQHPTQRN